MTLSKSARYALYAALEMAQAGDDPVTVAGVAARNRISRAALAKVFQQLVRSGIAVGARGVGGGYRLAQSPATVSVLDVISIFETPRPAGRCLLLDGADATCPHPVECALGRLFEEVDELVRCTYASVSLKTLARRSLARAV